MLSTPTLKDNDSQSAVVIDPAVPGDLGTKTATAPAGTTFWLAPGLHTLGTGQFAQVVPKDRDTFLGAPGAVLDGAGINAYAFTQKATAVTISNLVIQGFRAPRNEGLVNHDSADGWVISDDVIQNNSGATASTRAVTGASAATLTQFAPPSEPIDQKVRSRNCRSSLT